MRTVDLTLAGRHRSGCCGHGAGPVASGAADVLLAAARDRGVSGVAVSSPT